jgi:glycosyltransferase involved in cell wall biosynthesis
MISVLTLTYHRKSLLEEAMQSFLCQSYKGCDYEMVIINDSNLVEYVYTNPMIKIVNHKERFSSIAAKIEFGYKQCKYDYIYRLDDDDLLSPNAIKIIHEDIIKNPGYDIYRSKHHYFFSQNKFIKLSDNINNGNMYCKKYLDRITFPDKTSDEDVELTFGHSGKIFHHSPENVTMIYRWGTGDYHISGIGTGHEVLEKVDKIAKIDTGIVYLNPDFKQDYYNQLPKND